MAFSEIKLARIEKNMAEFLATHTKIVFCGIAGSELWALVSC